MSSFYEVPHGTSVLELTNGRDTHIVYFSNRVSLLGCLNGSWGQWRVNRGQWGSEGEWGHGNLIWCYVIRITPIWEVHTREAERGSRERALGFTTPGDPHAEMKDRNIIYEIDTPSGKEAQFTITG